MMVLQVQGTQGETSGDYYAKRIFDRRCYRNSVCILENNAERHIYMLNYFICTLLWSKMAVRGTTRVGHRGCAPRYQLSPCHFRANRVVVFPMSRREGNECAGDGLLYVEIVLEYL